MTRLVSYQPISEAELTDRTPLRRLLAAIVRGEVQLTRGESQELVRQIRITREREQAARLSLTRRERILRRELREAVQSGDLASANAIASDLTQTVSQLSGEAVEDVAPRINALLQSRIRSVLASPQIFPRAIAAITGQPVPEFFRPEIAERMIVPEPTVQAPAIVTTNVTPQETRAIVHHGRVNRSVLRGILLSEAERRRRPGAIVTRDGRRIFVPLITTTGRPTEIAPTGRRLAVDFYFN